MRVDVKTATAMEVRFNDVEEFLYLTSLLVVGVRYTSEMLPTCNDDIDGIIL